MSRDHTRRGGRNYEGMAPVPQNPVLMPIVDTAITQISISGSVVQAGNRFTFTLPTSGHTDPDDGIAVVIPLRDIRGRVLTTVDSGGPAQGTSKIMGSISVDQVTDPTAGNGVQLWAAITYGDGIGGITKAISGGVIDYAATRQIKTVRGLGAAWTFSSAAVGAGAGIIFGGLGQHIGYFQNVHSYNALGEFHSVVANFGITGFGTNGRPYLALGAFRPGATGGIETVAVDVAGWLAYMDVKQ
jgi:hypothetical protein